MAVPAAAHAPGWGLMSKSAAWASPTSDEPRRRVMVAALLGCEGVADAEVEGRPCSGIGGWTCWLAFYSVDLS